MNPRARFVLGMVLMVLGTVVCARGIAFGLLIVALAAVLLHRSVKALE